MPIPWTHATLTLSLSNICNFRCRHCFTDSLYIPVSAPEMSPEEVEEYLSSFYARGGRVAAFIGGEPTLSLESLLAGLKFCRSHGMHSTLTSNCWWGSEAMADMYADLLGRIGLSHLICSFDKYHAEFNTWENVVRVMRRIERYGTMASLTWVSREDEPAFWDEVKSFAGPVGLRIAQNRLTGGPGFISCVGRAKTLPDARRSTHWICPGLKSPVPAMCVEPGQRITYRCGLANPAMSFAFTGDVTEAADRLEDSPFFRALSREGVMPLLRKYKATGYRDICELCHEHMADWRKEYAQTENRSKGSVNVGEAISARLGTKARKGAKAGRRRVPAAQA